MTNRGPNQRADRCAICACQAPLKLDRHPVTKAARGEVCEGCLRDLGYFEKHMLGIETGAVRFGRDRLWRDRATAYLGGRGLA